MSGYQKNRLKKQIQFRLDEAVYNKVSEIAIRKRLSRYRLIVEIIEEWIRRVDG